MKKCKQVLLPKDEMDALFSSRILSPGCDMHINTVPSFKFNNVEIKPRAMLFNIGSGTVLCSELNGMTLCCLYQLEGCALSMEASQV